MSDTEYPQFRVANSSPEEDGELDSKWNEKPNALDVFKSVPDGTVPQYRSTGSYPLRSMSTAEALNTIPILAVLFSKDRVKVRPVPEGVQISVTDHHLYSKGLRAASSTRRQFQKTLNLDDWGRVRSILEDPEYAAILGKLPGDLSNLTVEMQKYLSLLEARIVSIYETE